MAYTFLQAMNTSLKQAGEINSDLSSFTDSGIQRAIDVMIQSWNDAIDHLFSLGVFRGEQASSSFTLVTGTTEYSIASDGIDVSSNPVDETNNNVLTPYPGGFDRLRQDKPDLSDYSGRPRHWTRNPVNDKIVIDTTPTSDENGDVYTYLYTKRINLSATTDSFPFTDDVVDALQHAVLEIYQNKMKNRNLDPLLNASFLRAVNFLSTKPRRNRYGTRYA